MVYEIIINKMLLDEMLPRSCYLLPTAVGQQTLSFCTAYNYILFLCCHLLRHDVHLTSAAADYRCLQLKLVIKSQVSAFLN